jgi:hypothetical protein
MPKKPLKKAIDTPRGPGTSMVPVSPYNISVSAGGIKTDPSAGIVLGTGADWFGPLNPMTPIAPPEVVGRAWDFPPGYNLITRPRSYEIVDFPMMRALADSYDLLRLVIETRKDQITKIKWKIRTKEEATDKKAKTTAKQQDQIDEVEDFLERPDGLNRWKPWLRSLLEDVFVLDAPALYMQRNRGGRLIALKQVDGALIKPIIDDWGRTPQPQARGGTMFYPPAYQATLKGLPATNYTTRDMIYRPYNRRAQKAYGYSPVEQIIITVNIALRRQMYNLAYYTEGNIPEALIGTPDNWTPEQIVAFQNNWDQMFTGNLAQRRHAKFVPGGVAKTFIPTKEPDLKNPMDEWLARIVCFAFSISPQPFVIQMNRATAGTAQEVAKEEGVEPLKEYIKELIDDVIEQEFENDELEFAWDEEVEVDQTAQTNLIAKRVEDGLITINQGREALGEETSDDPAADVLMVKTATGYVPIDANTIDGKQASIDAGITADPTIPKTIVAPPGTPGANGEAPGSPPAKGSPQEPPAKGADKPKASDTKGAAKSAAKAYAHGTRRFMKAARRSGRTAPDPFARKAPRAARSNVKKLFAQAFRKAAKKVAAQVRRADVGKLAKADTPDDIARDAELDAIEQIVVDLGDEFADVATDIAEQVLAQLGVTDAADLVDQVNEAAVTAAREQAAELVTQIEDTTREMIRGVIADGLEQNIGTDEIAQNIMDSTGFSETRADLIANTEVRNANSQGALEGYRGANSMGLTVQKEWLLGDNPCEICEANADDGPIDVDDDFSSGDDAPPAHPNCECAVSPVVVDDGSDVADAEE